MAEFLKNIYDESFFSELTSKLEQIIPNFQKDIFLKEIYSDNWEKKELKQRMRHIATVLQLFLKPSYSDAIKQILQLVKTLQQENITLSLKYMFIPDFVEVFGIDYKDISLEAMEEITTVTSCEFAIRPFIVKYSKDTIQKMYTWSQHTNSQIRRLASEGCRPRLPWAMALPELKNNPEPILPILENLKNDEAETVRKSVANNLNDIAKDNPDIVINIAKNWKGKHKNTDWIVKHGCRTLFKQGNREIMELFGFPYPTNISVTNFQLTKTQIHTGEYLEFSCNITNQEQKSIKIRLEYAVYYQKANKSLSKKVYKISEKEIGPNETITLTRKQSFKQISTRVFHLGIHQISLIINGREFETYDFYLV